ncbi:MAG: hypothetical protein V1858_04700 [Candidatus Gottesmanbacteria bacterium]
MTPDTRESNINHTKKEFVLGKKVQVYRPESEKATTIYNWLDWLQKTAKDRYKKLPGISSFMATKGINENGNSMVIYPSFSQEDFSVPIRCRFKDKCFPDSIGWFNIEAGKQGGIILQPAYVGTDPTSYDPKGVVNDLEAFFSSDTPIVIEARKEVIPPESYHEESDRHKLPYAQALKEALGLFTQVTVSRKNTCIVTCDRCTVISQPVESETRKSIVIVFPWMGKDLAVTFDNKDSGETVFKDASFWIDNWRVSLSNNIPGVHTISFNRGTELPLLEIRKYQGQVGLKVASPKTDGFWHKNLYEVKPHIGYGGSELEVSECNHQAGKVRVIKGTDLKVGLATFNGEEAELTFTKQPNNEILINLKGDSVRSYTIKSLSARVPLDFSISWLLRNALFKPQEYRQRANIENF